jgi:hypothetical protein
MLVVLHIPEVEKKNSGLVSDTNEEALRDRGGKKVEESFRGKSSSSNQTFSTLLN